MDLLRERNKELHLLTDALMEREELSENEITELIGPSIHAQKSAEAQPSDSKSESVDVVT